MSVPPEIRDQLSEIFAAANCLELFEAAIDWWVENGAATIKEFAEKDVFAEFEKDTGLKRLQARRLRIALDEALKDSSEAASRETVGVEQLQDVEVKNTFIDYKLPSASRMLTAGNRAQTVAGNYSGHIGSLPEHRTITAEPDDWTAPMPNDCESTPAKPDPTPKLSSSLLQRFQTHEDYGFSLHGRTLERFGTHEDYGFALYEAPPGVENTTEDESAEREMEHDLAPPLNPFMPPPGMPMAPHFPMMPMMGMMPMPMPYMPMPSMYMPGMYPNLGAERETKPQTVQFFRKHYRRRDGKNEHRNQYHWTVDGRKLRSSDREAVSPSFTVKDCFDLEFKLLLKPKVVEYVKGGSSFRNSRGKGYIELRCVSENSALLSCEATLSFKLSISSAKRTEKFRGSVFHNFRERATCGLVESQDEWEFGRIVDDSGTFVVILEVDPKSY